MAEFPALPLWTDSYLADTGHLTDAEHGLYLRFLMLMWRSPECRVPNDDAWLARRLGKDADAMRTHMRPLIDEFCQTDGNWITQKRLLKEWNWCRNKSAKASDSAKRRWDKEKHVSDGNATQHSERNAPTPTPTPTPKKEVKGPDGPDLVLVAFNDWNKLAEELGLAKALKLTDTRRRQLKARLEDCGGIVGWVKVMDAVRNSPFLKGQNDRNWQADLDFVLQAGSFIKIQEGKYAPKNGLSSIDWKKVLGDDFDPAASV